MTHPVLQRSESYGWLDCARAAAALAVLAEHVRAFLFVDFGEALHPNWMVELFYFATGLGHQAVVVFFVLSGFLVGGQVWALSSEGRWSWSEYAIARLARLWTVLIPALILTAVWDRLGMSLTHSALYAGLSHGYYHSTPIDLGGIGAYSPVTFLMNVLFLQTVSLPKLGMIPTFGTNGPLWSLANEAWYYLLFPLILVPLRSFRTANLSGALMIVSAALLCVLLPREMVLSGSIWLMGAALFAFNRHLPPSRRASAILSFFALAMFAGCLWRSRLVGAIALESDLSVGLSFALLLGALIRCERAPKMIFALSRHFAAFSYTLYLTHFPLAAAIACVLLKNRRLQPCFSTAMAFGFAMTLLMIYAYGVSLLFEANTKRIQVVVKRCAAAWLPLPVGACKAGGRL